MVDEKGTQGTAPAGELNLRLGLSRPELSSHYTPLQSRVRAPMHFRTCASWPVALLGRGAPLLDSGGHGLLKLFVDQGQGDFRFGRPLRAGCRSFANAPSAAEAL